MVGLIQKLLLEMILELGGEETLKEVKRKANLPEDHEFKMNNVYPDDQWQRLLEATLETLQITPDQAEAAYADYFLKDVITRFPVWFQMSKNSYEFLSIQPTIHNCFASGVADQKSREGITDKFKIEQLPNKLITFYKSPNGHCGLYIHLAKAIIAHYADEAQVEEKKCMKTGNDNCEIHIEWSKIGT